MNLQKKAIYIIAGILFIVIGINSLVLTVLASNKYRKVILAKTTAMGESIQQKLNEISSAGVPVSGIVGVGQDLGQLVQNDETIGFAMVADTSGWILFHSDDAKRGGKISEPELAKSLSSTEKITRATGVYYHLFFPLADANKQTVAMLILGVKTRLVGELIYGIALVSILCLLFSIGLVYFFISRHITEPVLRVERVAERIAAGNLTEELEIRGSDEIAMLGRAINKISGNLRQMLSKIAATSQGIYSITADVTKTAGESLATAHQQRSSVEEAAEAVNKIKEAVSDVSLRAEMLTASAGQVSVAMTGMTASLATLAGRAADADSSAAETSASVEEMSANVKGIAESIEHLVTVYDSIYASVTRVTANVRKVEASAGESARLVEAVKREASESGLASAQASMAGMEQIKVTVGSLSETINMLGDRSEDIGRIVEVIDEIADRTNLLALNSAILAAQAGIHGKPFEVVAHEMKDLAEKTSGATQEIADVILSVQHKIGESVHIAGKGMETIARGFKLVAETNKVLYAIKESSEKSTELSRAIQEATAEQAGEIFRVTEAMGSMTEKFQYINRAMHEQTRASHHIVVSMDETKEMAHAAMKASEEQKEVTREVTAAMETVMTNAGRILDAARDQLLLSRSIESLMDKVDASALNVETSATNLEGIVFLLKKESGSLLNEVQQITLEEAPTPPHWESAVLVT